MKQTLIALVLVSVATLTLAATNKPSRTLEVTGTGRVSVAPDICYMRFGAETTSPQSASAAYRDNCAIMSAIVDALKAAGITAKDIQTTYLYMVPRYTDDSKTGKRSLSHYSVDQSVSVKVRDLSKVSSVLDAAVAAGANSVGSVDFTVEDAGKYTEKARSDALKDAKSKAEKIAADAGARLGNPIAIVVGSDYDSRGRVSVGGMAYGGGGSQLQVGETELTQNVAVTYELK